MPTTLLLSAWAPWITDRQLQSPPWPHAWNCLPCMCVFPCSQPGQPATAPVGVRRKALCWRGTMQAEVEQYREIAKRVLPLVGDTVELINNAWDAGKRILVEGANATMLDLDFGTYPFVTSSNASIGGAATGLGLAPTKFQAVIGVVRSPRITACLPGLAWDISQCSRAAAAHGKQGGDVNQLSVLPCTAHQLAMADKAALYMLGSCWRPCGNLRPVRSHSTR